jgi:hypothetical protein
LVAEERYSTTVMFSVPLRCLEEPSPKALSVASLRSCSETSTSASDASSDSRMAGAVRLRFLIVSVSAKRHD